MVNLYKDPEGKAIFPVSDPANSAPPHQSSSNQEHSADVQTVKSLKTRIAELEAALSHINQVCLNVNLLLSLLVCNRI